MSIRTYSYGRIGTRKSPEDGGHFTLHHQIDRWIAYNVSWTSLLSTSGDYHERVGRVQVPRRRRWGEIVGTFSQDAQPNDTLDGVWNSTTWPDTFLTRYFLPRPFIVCGFISDVGWMDTRLAENEKIYLIDLHNDGDRKTRNAVNSHLRDRWYRVLNDQSMMLFCSWLPLDVFFILSIYKVVLTREWEIKMTGVHPSRQIIVWKIQKMGNPAHSKCFNPAKLSKLSIVVGIS